ncbi:MAG: methylmalonyl-CoA mutase [Chloroflexi bacterium]|nr:methylmalonyl-CoA mutase [Chloroflexota bacterium]
MGDSLDAARKENWVRRNNLDKMPKAQSQTGADIDVIYTPADVANIDYDRDLGFPGEYPYTRGVHPAMYRVQPWQMRQFSGFGSAEETNARWKYLMEQGSMGVIWAFDLPTQLGYDSDHPKSLGEVGRSGLAINTLKDFELVYEGLPVGRMVTNMVICAPANILLAMYVALAEKKGIPVESLRGTIINDVLVEYMAQGNWIYPAKPTLRLAGDVIEYCTKHLPKFNALTVRGYSIGDSGANPAEEIAFTLAAAFAYMQNVLDRGMNVDEVAPGINFYQRWDCHFLEVAAKLRAARRLWARTLKEKYGAIKPESMMMRISGQVGGNLLRAQEPENNLVRGAYALLGAVLGGAQGAHQPSLDEAYATPTQNAVRLALRTQQICAYETGIMDTVDPLAGSYYVEALTNQIEQEIRKVLGEIEAMGGIVAAIESGYIRERCSKNAYQATQDEESGKRVVVGVNRFKMEEKQQPLDILKVGLDVAQRQIERTKQVKATRDNEAVRRALKRLEEAARKNENTLPATIEAVKAYATMGEMCDTLRGVFGVFREPKFAV